MEIGKRYDSGNRSIANVNAYTFKHLFGDLDAFTTNIVPCITAYATQADHVLWCISLSRFTIALFAPAAITLLN